MSGTHVFETFKKVYSHFKAYCLSDAPTSLTFNNCTLCPHCIYVFCIYLRTNSDLCHLQHKVVGFITEKKSVLRGTDWVFKESSLRFVFKELILDISIIVPYICTVFIYTFFPMEQHPLVG